MLQFKYFNIFIVLFILIFTQESFAQQVVSNKKTVVYATKDTNVLKMDIYNAVPQTKKPCVLFVFGGGFISGSRDDKNYSNYFNMFIQQGYVVASIDYRLGLKGGKKVTPLHTKPLKEAIDMAVDDLFSATNFLLQHAHDYGIDTSNIILSGSSSGAVTALEGEWELCNRNKAIEVLPAGFNYAGVIAFAGAIFSYSGKPTFKTPPPPVMMFHGTEDKLVYYNKKRFFNTGLFGSYSLAKIMRKNKFPYYFQSVEGLGHEVAETPMNNNQKDILWFIDEYVNHKKQYMMNVDFRDMNAKRTFLKSAKDVY